MARRTWPSPTAPKTAGEGWRAAIGARPPIKTTTAAHPPPPPQRRTSTAQTRRTTRRPRAAKVDYAAGSTPHSVTAADFNGDGKADLAVAASFRNTVSVLLNNGNGTFAAKVDYGTGSFPHSVTTADFNGDGKVDLAVAN